MTYAELFDLFHRTINKNPRTPDALAQTFINFGIKRIENRLTLDIQKTTVSVNASSENTFPIPDDVLSFVKVSDDKGIIPRASELSADERGFYTSMNSIKTLHDVEVINIEYYSNYPKDLNPTSASTALSDIEDLVLYAALIYAAEYWADERLPSYTTTFETLVAEYENAQRTKNFSGNLVVRNPYGDYF